MIQWKSELFILIKEFSRPAYFYTGIFKRQVINSYVRLIIPFIVRLLLIHGWMITLWRSVNCSVAMKNMNFLGVWQRNRSIDISVTSNLLVERNMHSINLFWYIELEHIFKTKLETWDFTKVESIISYKRNLKARLERQKSISFNYFDLNSHHQYFL